MQLMQMVRHLAGSSYLQSYKYKHHQSTYNYHGPNTNHDVWHNCHCIPAPTITKLHDKYNNEYYNMYTLCRQRREQKTNSN